MSKHFTLNHRKKNSEYLNKNNKEDSEYFSEFMDVFHVLNERTPKISDIRIGNILNFAKAYKVYRGKNIGNIEMMIN